MSDLCGAAEAGDLERVQALVNQGADKEKTGDSFCRTPLYFASRNGQLAVVRYLVEQGADMNKVGSDGWTPLIIASINGHLEAVLYLLEQGADRDKADRGGYTSLHYAALQGQHEVVKLLMVLNARTDYGLLPIDMGYRNTEEIKQAIRDEPQRRDQQPRKRCIEQDQHTDAAASSASAQQEEEEQSNKKPRLEGEAEDGEVADEDQNSEPSDDEDGN